MRGRKHRAVKASGFLARASLIIAAVLVQTNASPAHGGAEVPTGKDAVERTSAAAAESMHVIDSPFGADRGVAGEAELPGWRMASKAGAARDISLADGVRVPIIIRVSEEDVRMAAEDGGRLASLIGASWVDMIAYVVVGNGEDRPILKTAGGYVGTRQGLAMDVIGRLARGKPRLVFIDSGNGGGDGAALDADELRAVVWSAVIHGASGIIYDDRGPAPGTSDGTAPARTAEMVEIHRLMKDMGNILLAPTGLPNGVLLRMAPRGEVPAPDMMPYPFEARAYRTGNRVFYAILNLSQEGAAVLDYAPFGISGMAFRRYEVKFGYLPDYASYGRTGEAP